MAPRDARSARDVSILVGLGALVRLALLLRGSGVSGDEAAIGVNGLAIRHGEFPIYFAGQSFMGAAGDAYLAGLAYIVLGVAPVTLELVGVLLSIAWAALVVRLVWEAWGSRAAAYAALWLAVPPDFVLWWAQEARPHYHLPLVLGVLGLLLARRVPGSSPATAARRLLVLGLLMGLAYWTNFLSIVYLPAVLLRLALGRYRPRSFRELALPPLGFALGALPHLLYTWHQNSPIPPFDVGAGVAGVLARLPSLARAWPVLLGVPLELAGPAAPPSCCRVHRHVPRTGRRGRERESRRHAPAPGRPRRAVLRDRSQPRGRPRVEIRGPLVAQGLLPHAHLDGAPGGRGRRPCNAARTPPGTSRGHAPDRDPRGRYRSGAAPQRTLRCRPPFSSSGHRSPCSRARQRRWPGTVPSASTSRATVAVT